MLRVTAWVLVSYALGHAYDLVTEGWHVPTVLNLLWDVACVVCIVWRELTRRQDLEWAEQEAEERARQERHVVLDHEFPLLGR